MPRRRLPPAPADPRAFYPSNCANGPQRRAIAIAPNVDHRDGGTRHIDPNFDSDPEPLPHMMDNDLNSHPNPESEAHISSASNSQPNPAPEAQSHQAGNVDVAAQLMSAELLVDLATSTLAAANRLKELYLAQHMQRSARGSLTSLPPTGDEIANAKVKVREAAGVMYDLAA